MKYFRVFGSKYYNLRDREHLGKFDSQSDGVFLGYSLNSKAYHVYNLHTLTVMESINVVIDDASVQSDGILIKDCDSDSGGERREGEQ